MGPHLERLFEPGLDVQQSLRLFPCDAVLVELVPIALPCVQKTLHRTRWRATALCRIDQGLLVVVGTHEHRAPLTLARVVSVVLEEVPFEGVLGLLVVKGPPLLDPRELRVLEAREVVQRGVVRLRTPATAPPPMREQCIKV